MTAVIINLVDEANRQYMLGKIKLEQLLRIEMLNEGYNPNNREDVEEYWNTIFEVAPSTNYNDDGENDNDDE